MPAPTDVTEIGLELYGALSPLASEDEKNEWALLRYLDALISQAQPIRDQARDRSEKELGWSIVMNVDECPPYVLDWLSQFAGVDLTKLQQGVLTDEEFTALKRFRIKELPATKRGTPQAILNAASLHLTGAKQVLMQERPGGNPWRLEIITFEAETPEPALVREAIEQQLPAGIVLDYNVLAGLTWLLLRTEYTTWKEVKEAFVTWGGVRLDKPGT